MKWDCGPTPEERHAAKHEWHDFFPLFPRRVADHDCRWLETIERKGTYYNPGPMAAWWTWEYRVKENGR
jgi:hypothetical protein